MWTDQPPQEYQLIHLPEEKMLPSSQDWPHHGWTIRKLLTTTATFTRGSGLWLLWERNPFWQNFQSFLKSLWDKHKTAAGGTRTTSHYLFRDSSFPPLFQKSLWFEMGIITRNLALNSIQISPADAHKKADLWLYCGWCAMCQKLKFKQCCPLVFKASLHYRLKDNPTHTHFSLFSSWSTH